jgi:hypothetical protein
MRNDVPFPVLLIAFILEILLLPITLFIAVALMTYCTFAWLCTSVVNLLRRES